MLRNLPTSPASKKVIGLVRVSTNQQAEDDRGGMPRQHAVIERTVQVHNLQCQEVVILPGVSGTEVRGNPEVQRILGLIQKKEIQGVVVADLDRLLRPAQFEDLALFDVFCEANAFVYCGGESYDFGSPEGKFMATVRSAFSGLERQLMLKRSAGAVRELCLAGKHPFGLRQLPRGITYDRKTSTWHVTTDIEPVLEAFRLIDQSDVHNVAEVARLTGINERALHNLLRNALYMGVRRYATGRSEKKVRSKRGKLYKPKVPLPLDQVIEVTVLKNPPVSRDRFLRVQAILEASTKAWKAEKKGEPINLVRSVARCAECQSRLYFSQDRRRPKSGGYYFCSKHYYKNNSSKKCSCGASNMSKAEVDSATNLFLIELLSKPSALRRILNHGASACASTASGTTSRVPGVIDFTFRKKRIKDGFETGLYSVEEAKQRLAQIRIEEETQEQSRKRHDKAQESRISEKLIRELVRGAQALRRSNDAAWRLKLLKNLLTEIHFRSGQIVAFKLQPTLIQNFFCEDGTKEGWGSSPRRA